MKRITLLTILLAFFAITACAQNNETDKKSDDNLNWHTNIEKAQKIAKEENKQILVNFTGSDWCGWCIKLDGEVFSQKAFQKYADENLVLVKVDFPRKTELSEEQQKYNKSLANKYKVRGFPTIVLLDENAKTIEYTGYQEGGATAYVKHLKELLN